MKPIHFSIGCYLKACNEAKIILIPDTSSLLSPLHFRRSQDFYIISNMEFSCNHSFSIKPQWTIYNCTTTCLYQLQVDTNIVETNYNDLYIPARVLPYGVYELKLTETVSNLSKSAFVEITPSGITANLVQLGTSVVTRGHRQDLKLDPGRYSIDRDGYQFNASVSENFQDQNDCNRAHYRTGYTNITVEYTVCTIFQIHKASI